MKDRTLLTTLILFLLTALILLAVLGRPILLAAGEMNVPALTLVGLACLLAGFLAGAYFTLSDRPGEAGEAQTPDLGTELTPVEKRSLALWWDDEPVILDLPHDITQEGIDHKSMSRVRALSAQEEQAITELWHSLTTEITS